ncbi:MAG: hypothetical protein AB1650_06505 [Candidatus Omnitrophota bacterium]
MVVKKFNVETSWRDVSRQEGNGVVDAEMTRRVISNGNESVLPTETSHRDGAQEIAGRETLGRRSLKRNFS